MVVVVAGDKGAVSEAAVSFFEELSRSGPHPLLAKARGTLRFDVVNAGRTRHWLVTLDRGSVSVSRRKGAAACVVRTEGAVFESLVTGATNALAAYLRGEVEIDGDPELLVLFQRMLPAAPRARE
jgi:predicted lipid carrier protein YhbT